MVAQTLITPTLATSFDSWLSSLRSVRTERAYRQACADFERATGKPVWEAGREDVRAWFADMAGRGLAATTQQQRAAAVASFMDYADLDDVTSGLAPKVNAYREVHALDQAEARALMAAIQEEIEQDPAHGWQGMALIGGYLMTGRRPGEWRELRWGDIAEQGGHMTYRWCWKGVIEQEELPRPIWEAIRAYLAAAGRLKSIQPGDAIFTALSNVADRLPTVQARPFEGARPISDKEVGRILRHYCRRAKLDPDRVTVRTLRYTAALLRRETGSGLTAITRMLGIGRTKTTERLLQRAEETRGSSWVTVAEMLGLPAEEKEDASDKKRRRRRLG